MQYHNLFSINILISIYFTSIEKLIALRFLVICEYFIYYKRKHSLKFWAALNMYALKNKMYKIK